MDSGDKMSDVVIYADLEYVGISADGKELHIFVTKDRKDLIQYILKDLKVLEGKSVRIFIDKLEEEKDEEKQVDTG